jgi:hypothetical protein
LAFSANPISVGGAFAIGALALCGWRPLRAWSPVLAVLPALAVGTSAPHREDWVPLLVAVFVWRGSLSTAQLEDQTRGSGLVPVLFAISAVGSYLCLPDTEQIIPLAVVAVLTAVCALVAPRMSYGGPGSMAMIGLLGWVASAGGLGRPAATIGGLGTLGVLVLAGGLAPPTYGVLVATQGVGVAVCSRVAGISHDVKLAVTTVAVTLCVVLITIVLSARWWPVRNG